VKGEGNDGDMTAYHLAQINIGRALAPLDDPMLAGFMSRLDEINALADTSPGFVWRLQSDSGNATDIQAYADPRMLINLSVWDSLESLFDFVYRSGHAAVMARRREWFERSAGPCQALWWVPAGHLPSVEEAIGRLDHLERHGPTSEAFTFKHRFAAPSDRNARSIATDAGAARCS
jgi:hypothetical protein